MSLRLGTTDLGKIVAAIAVAIACGTSASAADLIGYWNFDDLSIDPASPPGSGGVPTSITATTGTGTLSLTGFLGNVDDFTGTSINSIPPNTPGDTSLSLIPGAALVGNGGFIQFEFSMTGRTNFGVSYATQGTATGFSSNQWSYSTDGTSFTNFGPVIAPATAYSLTGPLVTTGLDNAATAFVRYTVDGGTMPGGNNRLDNIRLEHNATAPPEPNPASLPQSGDVVFGVNNSSTTNTLELVRGGAAATTGERFPSPWTGKNFIQSVEFDSFGGQRHNARGNLLGVDFNLNLGGTGAIYSYGTQGTIPLPAPQLIGNTGSTGPIGHDGSLTLSRLAGLSVSPDNSKIAVVGTDPGTVIVYDYTAGDTMGAGAALNAGRQTSADEATRILATGSTQSTAWLDNDTVLAFSILGDLYEVDADLDVGETTLDTALKETVTTPQIGSNVTSLAYNPDVSPYIYALYSGFNTSATPNSQTKLFVFERDLAGNYTELTDSDGVDLSLSSQTGREMALDEDGNLFISGFDSTLTFIPAAMAQNPASITDNSSVFWYQSTAAATSFVGMDIGFGAATLTGDYNGDGKVDAADYVVWRENPAGFGGEQGYTDWKANFGNPPGSGSALGAVAVPEPMSLTLLAIGGLGLLFGRRRAC